MDPIELTKELVSIPSVYPNEQKIAERLEEILIGIGFSVQRQMVEDNRYNLLAVRGEGSYLMFYGHMDTVPAEHSWENPYLPKEDEQYIYGLGSWDMKSGIAAIISAASTTDEPLKIAFGVDEENISKGAHMISSSAFLNDVKGIVVAEAGNDEHGHSAGQASVGRRGRVVFEITVYGESAHGAFSETKGKSAIENAMQIMSILNSMELPYFEKTYFGKTIRMKGSQFIRKIYGEAKGLSVPDKVVLELDRHIVVGETIEGIENELMKKLSSFNVSISLKQRETPYLMPYYAKEDSELLKIYSYLNNPNVVFAGSVADENIFGQKKDTITIGPSGCCEHSRNERVNKQSIIETSDLYEKIIKWAYQ